MTLPMEVRDDYWLEEARILALDMNVGLLPEQLNMLAEALEYAQEGLEMHKRELRSNEHTGRISAKHKIEHWEPHVTGKTPSPLYSSDHLWDISKDDWVQKW
jgi:hypothetical protein